MPYYPYGVREKNHKRIFETDSMKLSTRARYALRLMVTLARHTNGDNSVVSLSQVSREAKISRRYLEQLVIGLKNASLIRGRSGKGGGYCLALPADQIRIRQIIESAIGPINIVECVMQPEICLKSDLCECRMLYQLINQRITGVLDGLVLSDLAVRGRMKGLVTTLDGFSDGVESFGGRLCD
uniref:Transcriptional regulator n=1 Tax=uncultured sulfate-reducing bacterium TaxID=153939 RepID=Q3IBP1_9BACT|nr:Transcriptional regulator [uncultured sulfate-reducing bacterium]